MIENKKRAKKATPTAELCRSLDGNRVPCQCEGAFALAEMMRARAGSPGVFLHLRLALTEPFPNRRSTTLALKCILRKRLRRVVPGVLCSCITVLIWRQVIRNPHRIPS